jgi:hypothetical protein
MAIAIADAVIVLLFGALHAAGGREAVSVLSGTFDSVPDTALGLAYVLAWFALVLVVPITLLALILEAMYVRIRSRWPGWRRH